MSSEGELSAKAEELGDLTSEKGAGGSSSAAQTAGASAATNSRVEVSAQTIVRMMGIASATDLQLLEGRIDLLASRVSTLMMKVDKVLAGLGTLAGTGDVGRLETQIASIKSILREAVESIGSAQDTQKAGDRESAEAQSRKLKEGIRSSTES